MRYFYSVTTNAFYPAAERDNFVRAGSWPADAKQVDDSVYDQFSGSPPVGQRRVVGDKGLPTWGDIPPPTPEQLQQRAELQKRQLMSVAKEKIDICQDAVDLGMATDAEKSSLAEWRKYRVLLSRVDCSTAPDVKWPEQPK
ncbi:tail fiber assembly protein [Xenorhabdus bovienii]|uniref:tail fiber assembly protein n=1 Tax=Xenorhabdus bovienii TaxID=40576 RepID=UPI0023B2C237|nr:tail fiber assembly protein [Xenorhabdus bovienii]MDE9467412.1 tail fiber assembly protein [Xenorhabdus bovienii]